MGIFFRSRQAAPERVSLKAGESPGERLARFAVLALILGVVVWALHMRAQRNAEIIEAEAGLLDHSGTLSREHKTELRALLRTFKAEYGVAVKLRVALRDVEMPPPDKKTLAIGLELETRRMLLSLPPLLRKALGEGFVASLDTVRIKPSRDDNATVADLAALLDRIGRRLAAPSPLPVKPGGE